jgi:hypothetical protein
MTFHGDGMAALAWVEHRQRATTDADIARAWEPIKAAGRNQP